MKQRSQCLAALFWAPCLLAAALHPNLQAQTSVAEVRFTYENPKLQPAKYSIAVTEDGNGHYISEAGTTPADPANPVAGPQDRSIHISKDLRQQIFAVARKNKFFAILCDSHEKNIAFQGAKSLQYTGPDGSGSCQYNWSKNAQIDKLTAQLEAVSATLDEGNKLQRQYEHGRLSLDTELELLAQMVESGQALEVENIAPLLKTLAADQAVLQRVQRRAKALLEQAKTD